MYNLKNVKSYLFIVFIGFFGLYLSVSSQAYALEIKGMRFGQHGTAQRVVLDLDSEADFRASVQKDSESGRALVVIDVPRLSGQPMIGRTTLPENVVDIRLAPSGVNNSRLTFILSEPQIIRTAFLMPAEGNKPARLVLDLLPASPETFEKNLSRPHGTLREQAPIATPVQPSIPAIKFAGGSGIKLDPVGGPKAPEVAKPKTPEGVKQAVPNDLPLVMIDAGHGGIDSGAVGNGVVEKDVTLAVARAVKKALEDTGKYQAALTRDKDVFIRLGDRVRVARAADADLFVSIHADSVATGGAGVAGASFYTLSAQASDAQAASLAARENQSDTLGGVQLPTNDRDVKEILIDLAMRETTNQSQSFATSLVAAFRKDGIGVLPGPKRSAGFMVLKAPDVPSVLVELGFLSNPAEAAKLGQETYRAQLGTTIANGIDTYFQAKK